MLILVSWLLPYLVPLAWATGEVYCSSGNSGGSSGAYSDTYQSHLLCSQHCEGYEYAILQNLNCWCSNTGPSSVVSIDQCSQFCPGYKYENCGNEDDGLFEYIQLGDGVASSTSGSSLQATATLSQSSAQATGSSSSSFIESSDQSVYGSFTQSIIVISGSNTISNSVASYSMSTVPGSQNSASTSSQYFSFSEPTTTTTLSSLPSASTTPSSIPTVTTTLSGSLLYGTMESTTAESSSTTPSIASSSIPSSIVPSSSIISSSILGSSIPSSSIVPSSTPSSSIVPSSIPSSSIPSSSIPSSSIPSSTVTTSTFVTFSLTTLSSTTNYEPSSSILMTTLISVVILTRTQIESLSLSNNASDVTTSYLEITRTIATTSSITTAGPASSSANALNALSTKNHKESSGSGYWSSPGKIAGTFVPVGICVLAIVAAILFWIRRRQRTAKEFERNYNAAALAHQDRSSASTSANNSQLFVYTDEKGIIVPNKPSTEEEPPSRSNSAVWTVDQRLDPRRMLTEIEHCSSKVSLADDVDYSRKVLRVINE